MVGYPLVREQILVLAPYDRQTGGVEELLSANGSEPRRRPPQRLPEDLHRVALEERIVSDHLGVLHAGLGDEKAVERVTVMALEIAEGVDVRALDREHLHVAESELLLDDLLDRPFETKLSELVLDLDLPDRGDAEEEIVPFVLTGLESATGELLRRIIE